DGTAAATRVSEPPMREGLLDVLELVARLRPDLLRLVLKAVSGGGTLRRDVAMLAEELGVAEPPQLLEQLWHTTAAVDLLERNWPCRQAVLRDPATPVLAAVCEARRRNVAGRRRVKLTWVERKLRAQLGAASVSSSSAAPGEEVAEP
ncbi:MAG: hypothetical protein GY941_04875, partial [Planctomycetes bacterium]|nr:hypothetical protein [Planctomycetota bacterium]